MAPFARFSGQRAAQLVLPNDSVDNINDFFRARVTTLEQPEIFEITYQRYEFLVCGSTGLREILISPVVDFSRIFKKCVASASKILDKNVF